MTKHRFDSLCIGNAICDVLARVPEKFLIEQKLVKGAMRLIDLEEARRLEGLIGPSQLVGGGSASNTAVGIASLGGHVAYFGKVADDATGAAFREDIQAEGVTFRTVAQKGGPPTARSFVLITPDGERTMNTYLGACRNLDETDVEADIASRAHMIYLEGYLWDDANARRAFFEAARIGRENHARIAINLSAFFCVERFRNEWRKLVEESFFDLVFANEEELKAFFQVLDLEEAVARAARLPCTTVLTLGEGGAMVTGQGRTDRVAAQQVDQVVDLTGAGDLFVSGFLYGITHGRSWPEAARLGCACAAQIIVKIGARPQRPLKDLLQPE